jgi:zinc transport system permease protein
MEQHRFPLYAAVWGVAAGTGISVLTIHLYIRQFHTFLKILFGIGVIAMSLFAPILGVFLILRRQSLMSDTLSHVSLAGVAFGVMLGLSPTLSTVLIVLVAAVFLEYLRTIYKNFMEIGTAILMSTGLAVSLIIMSRAGGRSGVSL